MEAGLRIPEKLFFRIGEVCELIKVQPHVLRYWETEFPMLAPQKNRAGQRVYRRRDVEMVMRIRDLLYEEKFTIAGAKKKLMEENRAGASRARVPSREPARVEEAIVPDEESPEPRDEQPAPAFSHAPEPVSTSPDSDEKGAEETPGAAFTSGALRIEPLVSASEQALSPQANLAIRVIKRDLEDLLTMLNSDVSINR
ncbi:MAG TPA: MerR family transcriptional regulator [Blastocatellia bacterium]|jgi:DNA-binding transcriptional MerR regulator|nr:MerR family transcriptional regulator [Blastocatellia bacterium]